jgi:hypothetical protein
LEKNIMRPIIHPIVVPDRENKENGEEKLSELW